ncbi:MAG: AraC family transcriptional regulator [Hyphomicrobiales bacterium]|mgnify:CR=1 FL=1|nr:MAG: AraC family transcriptional regulator [Hyphomicrobiales bacterium]
MDIFGDFWYFFFINAGAVIKMAQSDSKSSSISRYALFGEDATRDDPDFVHIETITARSKLYDWKIGPHTHQRMFQLVYIAGGKAGVRLDQGRRTVTGPCAVTIPGGVVHGFDFEPHTQGWVLTVSELLLIDARYRRSRKLLEPIFGEAIILPFQDDPDSAVLIGAALEQIHSEFQWPRLGRSAMYEWLVRLILMTVRRQMDSRMIQPETTDRRHRLYVRFRQLVEDHYREQWPVTRYAGALALSQARLNRLCKSFTGKSAGELLQDRIALEAQRLLIYSSATSTMIAYDLGFQDPAYFSRFFKRRTGLSPKRFRQRKMAEPFPH